MCSQSQRCDSTVHNLQNAMPNRYLTPRLIIYLIIFALIIACRAVPVPSLPQQATATPTIAPTATLPRDSGWQELRPGMEQRVIRLFDNANRLAEHIFIIRLDPQKYRFEVAYRPDQPQSLEQWLTSTGALLVVNGGYFSLTEDKKYVVNGLTVVNGQPIGYSYGDFGGMLAVTADKVELRWLAQKPYNPAEPLQSALQSFPILVKPGGVLGFAAEHEDGKKARRTVIAQDKSGRIILWVADKKYFTLHQLSRYLTDSDLDLDMALNLDGGTSTGMMLAGQSEGIKAPVPLPIIIAVYNRP